MKNRIVYLSLLGLLSITYTYVRAADPYQYMGHGGGYGQYPQQHGGYYDEYGQFHPYPPVQYGQESYGYGSQGYPGYQHPVQPATLIPPVHHEQQPYGYESQGLEHQYPVQPAPTVTPAPESQEPSEAHMAALRGNIAELAYFLGTPGLQDIPDAEGHDTLWYAIEGIAPERAVEFLLKNFANRYDLTRKVDQESGDTYLHRARSPRIATLLLQHGAPINARNNANLSALDQAFVNRNNEIARVLINAGARVADQNGVLPFGAQTVIESIYGSNPVLVDVLLGRISQLETTLQQEAPSGFLGSVLNYATGGTNAAVNRAAQGLSPIFAAIYQGSIPAVALLILNGVNLDVRDAQGRTPLELARAYGQEQISALLHQATTARSNQERQTIAQRFLRDYRTAQPEGTLTPPADIFAGIAGQGEQVPQDTHVRLGYQHQAPTTPGSMFSMHGGGSGR
jgi:ankyrin repeat protein